MCQVKHCFVLSLCRENKTLFLMIRVYEDLVNKYYDEYLMKNRTEKQLMEH